LVKLRALAHELGRVGALPGVAEFEKSLFHEFEKTFCQREFIESLCRLESRSRIAALETC
jgi:hypothetical protein